MTEDETQAINREIAAAATKTTFEQITDNIATELDVPVREPIAALSDQDLEIMDREIALATMLHQSTPRSRWATEPARASDWPISRWYS